MLSITEVDAQSTVDDSASCDSSALDDAVKLIRKDFADLKAACASNQQQRPETEPSKQAVPSFLLCEYRTRDSHFL